MGPSNLMSAALAATVLLALPGCDRGDRGPGGSRPDVTGVAFQDASGQRRTLAEYRGKVVLVDVWATWCPPCRRSLPEIAELQKKADDRYAVLAISVDRGGFADVGPYLAANPQLGLASAVPAGSDALKPFGEIAGIPTTLVVDRQGRLRERWSGFYEGRAATALQQALQEP